MSKNINTQITGAGLVCVNTCPRKCNPGKKCFGTNWNLTSESTLWKILHNSTIWIFSGV